MDAPSQPAEFSVLESILVDELLSAPAALTDRGEPIHYIALEVADTESWMLTAQRGAISERSFSRERWLDTDLRAGTPDLDSTHTLRGWSSMAADEREAAALPLESDSFALRHAIRGELDRAFRAQSERLVLVRANQDVKVTEEHPAPDFETRAGNAVLSRASQPQSHYAPDPWVDIAIGLSTALESHPAVHISQVSIQQERWQNSFVDSEGARIQHGDETLQLGLTAQTVAADGDSVEVHRTKLVRAPSAPPSPEVLRTWVGEITRELDARQAAPRGTPYSGPVLLGGRATGVFFHEVFGHRVEGHRQKDEEDGHTFGSSVGTAILPAFLDVVDDPTQLRLADEDLAGFYRFDNEGVPARPTSLIRHGIFQGFLMSRSPIPGFVTSNGHGRRAPGNAPVARMGSLIVQAHQTNTAQELRQMLIREARSQGLAYGMVVDEITGGFTPLDRGMPNAFKLSTDQAWRVYVDGRPDERVRGIDLVGTPLAAFSHVIAAGDELQVFNGICGAESGWVPVSAAGPQMLVKRLEFQLEDKEQEKPPLLSKPATANDDGTSDLDDDLGGF